MFPLIGLILQLPDLRVSTNSAQLTKPCAQGTGIDFVISRNGDAASIESKV